jgi:galactosamine-6-phosphate isomerase
MNVLVADDYDNMSRLAADLILARLAWRSDMLLALALGETPVRTYQLICERLRNGPVSAELLRVLKINEWVGMALSDPASCEAHLRKHILDPLGIPAERAFGFSTDPSDYDEECRRMRDLLRRQGPIDLCVLGLGLNGHLGWNEPGDTLARTVHLSELSDSTQSHSLLGGISRAPTFGLTLGMGDLLQSRYVMLLVSGAHKAHQMRTLMDKDISTQFPASLLWTHPDAICICDKEAYALCE